MGVPHYLLTGMALQVCHPILEKSRKGTKKTRKVVKRKNSVVVRVETINSWRKTENPDARIDLSYAEDGYFSSTFLISSTSSTWITSFL